MGHSEGSQHLMATPVEPAALILQDDLEAAIRAANKIS